MMRRGKRKPTADVEDPQVTIGGLRAALAHAVAEGDTLMAELSRQFGKVEAAEQKAAAAHTFIVTYEYGYEGSSVQGAFPTFDAAETFAINALDPNSLRITEWHGGAPAQAWRIDDYWASPTSWTWTLEAVVQ